MKISFFFFPHSRVYIPEKTAELFPPSRPDVRAVGHDRSRSFFPIIADGTSLSFLCSPVQSLGKLQLAVSERLSALSCAGRGCLRSGTTPRCRKICLLFVDLCSAALSPRALFFPLSRRHVAAYDNALFLPARFPLSLIGDDRAPWLTARIVYEHMV